jgi:hypothetical protein
MCDKRPSTALTRESRGFPIWSASSAMERYVCAFVVSESANQTRRLLVDREPTPSKRVRLRKALSIPANRGHPSTSNQSFFTATAIRPRSYLPRCAKWLRDEATVTSSEKSLLRDVEAPAVLSSDCTRLHPSWGMLEEVTEHFCGPSCRLSLYATTKLRSHTYLDEDPVL